MTICDFLEGASPDNLNRSLGDIWSFDDKKIETVHNFVQWLFPLDEQSSANPDAPVLSAADIDEIRQSTTVRQNLLQSAKWYLNFLSRNSHWIRSHDHNHLRITRVIKSLRLLHSDLEANKFKQCVIETVARSEEDVSVITRNFWDRA